MRLRNVLFSKLFPQISARSHRWSAVCEHAPHGAHRHAQEATKHLFMMADCVSMVVSLCRRQLVAPRASAIEILQLAEAAGKEYGSVDAPSWVCTPVVSS